MTEAARGSATTVMVNEEATFNTDVAAAARRARLLSFNSCDMQAARAINQAATIRGDRNASQPFRGNLDVKGAVVVPVDTDMIGFFLKKGVGIPTTTEFPHAYADGGPDIKGTITTISVSEGSYTFGAGTPAATVAVGDRIIYEDASGTRYIGYIKTLNTALMTAQGGVSPSANASNATLIAVMQTKQATPGTPGTVTIASGVATFTVAQPNLAVGQTLIYDVAANKFAKVTAVTSTTVCTVTGPDGFAAPDATAKTVEWLGVESRFKHIFKVSPTAKLGSFVLQKAFTDLASPHYELYKGCKINTMELPVGGDGELLLTTNLLGATPVVDDGADKAYDYTPAPAAVSIVGTRFENFQASAEEGGSSVPYLKSFSITINNNLDGDTQCIGSNGIRRSLPEGVANVSGAISAMFEDNVIVNKADAGTESKLKLILTNGVQSLEFYMPEVIYEQKSPAIPGMGGIKLDLNYQAYYHNDANASVAVITLINHRSSY